MENKTQFLDTVLKLFYLNGAKTTTMDDIAKEFSMSKKTLYQLYANKDELLEDVLDYEMKLIVEALHKFDIKDDCPIHKMLYREDKIKDMAEGNNTIFARQMKKYYYHLYERQIYKIGVEVSKILETNAERGRALGLYREDFDVKEYAKYLMLIVFSYDDSPIVDTRETSRQDFTQNAILMYLNAITTEKGKEKLKGYIKKP